MKCLTLQPPTLPSRKAPLSLTPPPRRLRSVTSFRQSNSGIRRLVFIVSRVQTHMYKFQIDHDREAWLPPPLGAQGPPGLVALHRDPVARRIQSPIIPCRIEN